MCHWYKPHAVLQRSHTLSRVERRLSPSLPRSTLACFNGATRYRVWKVSTFSEETVATIFASTEPHAIACGKMLCTFGEGESFLLQRSHTLSRVERKSAKRGPEGFT